MVLGKVNNVILSIMYLFLSVKNEREKETIMKRFTKAALQFARCSRVKYADRELAG